MCGTVVLGVRAAAAVAAAALLSLLPLLLQLLPAPYLKPKFVPLSFECKTSPLSHLQLCVPLSGERGTPQV